MPIEAVIFDMDGVLVDSEVYWAEARVEFARDHGTVWGDEDHRLVMGRATEEWARDMQERMKLDMPIHDIIVEMKQRMMDKYSARLPVRPGAIDAVKLAAQHFRVGLASGSPTELIQHVMRLTGLDQIFEAMVYGDDIARGKPAPDIYFEALRRMNIKPENAVGIEDSSNGIRSLHAAGMYVIAAPSPDFILPPDVLQMAQHVVASLEEITLDMLRNIGD